MFRSIWRRMRYDPSALVSAIGLGIVAAALVWLAMAGLGAGGLNPGFAALAAGLGMAAAFLVLLGVLDGVARGRRVRARAETAEPAEPEMPSLRAYDSHPDAPARRPLSATDLEALEPVQWPSFRMGADDDVLELTTVVPMRSPSPEARPGAEIDERPTLGELLARLEFGVERRARAWPDAPPPAPDHALLDGLGAMRQATAR